MKTKVYLKQTSILTRQFEMVIGFFVIIKRPEYEWSNDILISAAVPCVFLGSFIWGWITRSLKKNQINRPYVLGYRIHFKFIPKILEN